MQTHTPSHSSNAPTPVINAALNYLAPGGTRARIRIFPPNCGIATERPPAVQQSVPIHDMRLGEETFSLDEHGFSLHRSPSAMTRFAESADLRARYYPEVERAVRELTGALAVFMFDHNLRSTVRAAQGEVNVRLPADQVHNDYTERSGPKRKHDILEAAGRLDLMDRHVAFVNLWRPIVGPVRDNPLALCDVRSVRPEDLVDTEIQHFGEDDLTKPRHTGEIYSVRYNPAHRWYYASEMQPDEVLLLKCYDSRLDGRARFMPHTGFQNPACPPDFVPRQSIEARTLVVFEERM